MRCESILYVLDGKTFLYQSDNIRDNMHMTQAFTQNRPGGDLPWGRKRKKWWRHNSGFFFGGGGVGGDNIWWGSQYLEVFVFLKYSSKGKFPRKVSCESAGSCIQPEPEPQPQPGNHLQGIQYVHIFSVFIYFGIISGLCICCDVVMARSSVFAPVT